MAEKCISIIVKSTLSPSSSPPLQTLPLTSDKKLIIINSITKNTNTTTVVVKSAVDKETTTINKNVIIPYDNITPVVSVNNSTSALNSIDTGFVYQLDDEETKTEEDEVETDEHQHPCRHNISISHRSHNLRLKTNKSDSVEDCKDQSQLETEGDTYGGRDGNDDTDNSRNGVENHPSIVCHEKVDLYLETPVVDERPITLSTNLKTALPKKTATGVSLKKLPDKTTANPKRLSDEFFSADDDDEKEIEKRDESNGNVIDCGQNTHQNGFTKDQIVKQLPQPVIDEQNTNNMINRNSLKHNYNVLPSSSLSPTSDLPYDHVAEKSEPLRLPSPSIADPNRSIDSSSKKQGCFVDFCNSISNMNGHYGDEYEELASFDNVTMIHDRQNDPDDGNDGREDIAPMCSSPQLQNDDTTQNANETAINVGAGSSNDGEVEFSLIPTNQNNENSKPIQNLSASSSLTSNEDILTTASDEEMLNMNSSTATPTSNRPSSFSRYSSVKVEENSPVLVAVEKISANRNLSASLDRVVNKIITTATTTTTTSAKINVSNIATLSSSSTQLCAVGSNKNEVCSGGSSKVIVNLTPSICTSTGTSAAGRQTSKKKYDNVEVYLNSNSNDSLSSDEIFKTKDSNKSSSSKCNGSVNDSGGSSSQVIIECSGGSGSREDKNVSSASNYSDLPSFGSSSLSSLTGNHRSSDTLFLDKLSALASASAAKTNEKHFATASSVSCSASSTCKYVKHCCLESNSTAELRKSSIQSNNNSFRRNDQFPTAASSSSSSFANLINDEQMLCSASGDSQLSRRNTTSNSSDNNFTVAERPTRASSLPPQQMVRDLSLGSDHIIEPVNNMSISVDHGENEFDEDTWVDCEEGSEGEEICTCREYTDEDINADSEDELPSRDVDLSGYNHIEAISGDILQETTSCNLTETPRLHRKRKLNENRGSIYGSGGSSTCINAGDEFSPYTDVAVVGRKRLALDNILTPKSNLVPLSPSLSLSSPSALLSPGLSLNRTPRLLIPTKNNPPPELNDWLVQFQRWSHAERLLAIDRLIDHCEPTQVRHMMKVIEPQFQRDFISLLPKELALQVLSYLEPKDLLRAAQTCRSWRFLCDDNLLWKEKCKQAGIVIEPTTDRPKRGRAGNMPPISSPWKAAYMRQHIIEMNWRSRPIRQPKILKGHDDHVITCLQFCGNRIVSGSDDNTLKVWSAITGKCLRTLVGHTGGVWSSQMSGNIIISGSTDRTLKVWNADSGQCIHTLYGHTSTVRCMHLHGNKVVSGSRDATLRVWDINQGTCLHVLVGHLAAVRCVQYDGKLVVSGAYDYMVKVWNPERQECLHTLQGHTNRVYSLQFDGVHVVSGSLDTSIRVWDAETGSCKHTLMGHQSLTSGMELRQNILVSGNADSTVKVWDILTGQCLQTLSGPNKHQSAVTCLQFNTRFVITSSDDGTVKLWDVRTGEFIRNLVALDSGGSGGVVWRIRSNDTKLICAVGSRNGTEETKLMVLDFDVEGACLKCS